jgi:hypothetical protein
MLKDMYSIQYTSGVAICSYILYIMSSLYTHRRVNTHHRHLDDLFHNVLPTIHILYDVCNMCMRISFAYVVYTALAYTQYTYLIVMLYTFILRSISICLTILPLATQHKYVPQTTSGYMKLIMTADTVGDHFFSGHMVAITVSAIVYSNQYEYYYGLLIGYVLFNGICLLISREHYSIDVVFGIIIPYFMWVLVHTDSDPIHPAIISFMSKIL